MFRGHAAKVKPADLIDRTANGQSTKKADKTPRRWQRRARNALCGKIDVFRKFSAEELVFIQTFKSGELVLEAGSTIFSEGTNSPHLYTRALGLGLQVQDAWRTAGGRC